MNKKMILTSELEISLHEEFDMSMIDRNKGHTGIAFTVNEIGMIVLQFYHLRHCVIDKNKFPKIIRSDVLDLDLEIDYVAY